LHAFIATSASDGVLTASLLQDRPEMKTQAVITWDAVHQHGMLHNDVVLRNFVMSGDGQAVWAVVLIVAGAVLQN
jgi:tRNA A-37 threonylcarbamoyl transferase component Bud32